MVMFTEGEYNPKDHAELLDSLYGTLSEDDIDLIVGVDDDAIKLVKPKEKEENE